MFFFYSESRYRNTVQALQQLYTKISNIKINIPDVVPETPSAQSSAVIRESGQRQESILWNNFDEEVKRHQTTRSEFKSNIDNVENENIIDYRYDDDSNTIDGDNTIPITAPIQHISMTWMKLMNLMLKFVETCRILSYNQSYIKMTVKSCN